MITDIKNVIRVIEERISICDKTFEASKDEKWIHIGIILEGLYQEITGKRYRDACQEKEQ